MEDKIKILKQKLKGGIFPATPIPFDENGNIVQTAQESYLKYMKNEPVDGFAIWAHTGRGLLIDDEKKTYIMNSWRKAFPDKLIIAGVGANAKSCINVISPSIDYINKSVEMAVKAKELGADAALVYAPVLYRDDKDVDEKVIEYHKQIAKAGLPIILFYLYKEAGGVSYSPRVLDELLKMEEVVGIKMATLDSVMTYQSVSNLISCQHPDKIFITGEDRMFGYTLMRGADAALVGLGSICTSMQKDMMNSYFSGNYEEFINLSSKVDKLAECTFIKPMEGYIKRLLIALYLLGVIPFEATYDPYGPIKNMETCDIKLIESVLKEISQFL